jgi:hypothetical protein
MQIQNRASICNQNNVEPKQKAPFMRPNAPKPKPQVLKDSRKLKQTRRKEGI